MDKWTKKLLWAFFNGVFFIVFTISCLSYGIFLLTMGMYYHAGFMFVISFINITTIDTIRNCMKTYHNIEAIERNTEKSKIDMEAYLHGLG